MSLYDKIANYIPSSRSIAKGLLYTTLIGAGLFGAGNAQGAEYGIKFNHNKKEGTVVSTWGLQHNKQYNDDQKLIGKALEKTGFHRKLVDGLEYKFDVSEGKVKLVNGKLSGKKSGDLIYDFSNSTGATSQPAPNAKNIGDKVIFSINYGGNKVDCYQGLDLLGAGGLAKEGFETGNFQSLENLVETNNVNATSNILKNSLLSATSVPNVTNMSIAYFVKTKYGKVTEYHKRAVAVKFKIGGKDHVKSFVANSDIDNLGNKIISLAEAPKTEDTVAQTQPTAIRIKQAAPPTDLNHNIRFVTSHENTSHEKIDNAEQSDLYDTIYQRTKNSIKPKSTPAPSPYTPITGFTFKDGRLNLSEVTNKNQKTFLRNLDRVFSRIERDDKRNGWYDVMGLRETLEKSELRKKYFADNELTAQEQTEIANKLNEFNNYTKKLTYTIKNSPFKPKTKTRSSKNNIFERLGLGDNYRVDSTNLENTINRLQLKMHRNWKSHNMRVFLRNLSYGISAYSLIGSGSGSATSSGVHGGQTTNPAGTTL